MHKTNKNKSKISFNVNIMISMASAKICKYIIHFKEKHRKQQAQIITLLKIQLTCVYGCVCTLSMQENPGKRKQPEFFKCERHSVHKPYVSIER